MHMTTRWNVVRSRRWRWDSRVNFVIGGLAFAWFRLWQGTTAPTLIWQDSKNYEAIGSQALWSSGFWFGGRPPLTPFLWKLTGSPDAFAIGQTVLSVIAWTLLGWTVGGLFPPGWRRLTGYLVILAFATTTPIVLWDRSVLSESLALSGLALLFASALRLAQKPTPPRASLLVGAALWCALARDTEILLPATLGLALLVFALTRRRSLTFHVSIATACALLLVAGFCIATVVESGRDTLNTTDNLYVRVFPYPARVAWFAAHGMPEERQIDNLAATEPRPAHGAAKTVFPDLSSREFAHLNAWINSHGATTYSLWIIEHPWLVVLEPFRRPERSFNNAGGDINGYAAENRVTSGLSPVLWPPWVWLLGVSAVVVVVLDERTLEVNRVVQAVVGLGLLGIVAMFAAWNGDGQETTRHTLEGLAEVHLAVLIMLLYVALTRSPARNNVSDPEPVADLTPTT
jgi:hypothetical protein